MSMAIIFEKLKDRRYYLFSDGWFNHQRIDGIGKEGVASSSVYADRRLLNLRCSVGVKGRWYCMCVCVPLGQHSVLTLPPSWSSLCGTGSGGGGWVGRSTGITRTRK